MFDTVVRKENALRKLERLNKALRLMWMAEFPERMGAVVCDFGFGICD